MKTHLVLMSCIFVCFVFVLSPHNATALRFEFDSADEIADWELGPDTTAEVKDGMLELTVASGDSGIYFGEADWTDYRMEVRVRKQDGDPYFHLFTRVQVPVQDFYFMEISYNSNTTSVYVFEGGTSTEITGGPRPARPESTDTDGGDAYTIVFEVEGNTLKTFIDGQLMVETTDDTYANGRPGLGGRTSTVWYEYVEITGPGIDEGGTSVDSAGKLAVTWGDLKNQR
jgi:hypothetical protein